MVTYTGQVTYSSASDEDYRVFLEIVSDTGNVSGCFHSVGKLNSCDLTKCGVGLLRSGGGYLRAYASLLGAADIGLYVLNGVKAVPLFKKGLFKISCARICTSSN